MATANRTVYFKDIYGTDIGSMTYTDGVITGATEGDRDVIESLMDNGYTAEGIIDKFSNWDNGYSESHVETPPESK